MQQQGAQDGKQRRGGQKRALDRNRKQQDQALQKKQGEQKQAFPPRRNRESGDGETGQLPLLRVVMREVLGATLRHTLKLSPLFLLLKWREVGRIDGCADFERAAFGCLAANDVLSRTRRGRGRGSGDGSRSGGRGRDMLAMRSLHFADRQQPVEHQRGEHFSDVRIATENEGDAAVAFLNAVLQANKRAKRDRVADVDGAEVDLKFADFILEKFLDLLAKFESEIRFGQRMKNEDGARAEVAGIETDFKEAMRVHGVNGGRASDRPAN